MKAESLLYHTLLALIAALSFSAFIYLDYLHVELKLLDSILGVLALALLLYLPKRAILIFGFFTGLLWFYWIGYSFKYYNHPYFIPFVSLLFGFIYLLFFAPLALSKEYYIRAAMLFGLSFFEPFDFNWLQIEAIFVKSYFGVQKYQLLIILLSLATFLHFKTKQWAPAILITLLFALHIPTPKAEAPLKIKLVTTQLPQELKWKESMQMRIVTENFRAIEDAIKEGEDVVVLPESAFALFLNRYDTLLERLKALSYEISIVTGALYYEEGKNYNVTYIFDNGEYSIAKKMVLVPFGEYIPLPKFLHHFINSYFFDGAEDYAPAAKPTDFSLGGVTFRNAICYEATCKEIYEDNPQYVIAMSNNGWFTPSIEPTLQMLLMRFYTKKYGTIIYHSANIAKSGIVK